MCHPVGELEGGPRLVDGVDQQAEGGNTLVISEAEQPRLRTRLRLHGGDLDGNEARAALGAPRAVGKTGETDRQPHDAIPRR